MCDIAKSFMFQAVADYESTGEGELSFKIGDVIRLVESVEGDSKWAKGELNDKIGRFRMSLVTEHKRSEELVDDDSGNVAAIYSVVVKPEKSDSQRSSVSSAIYALAGAPDSAAVAVSSEVSNPATVSPPAESAEPVKLSSDAAATVTEPAAIPASVSTAETAAPSVNQNVASEVKSQAVDDGAVVSRRSTKAPPPLRPKTAIFPPAPAPKPGLKPTGATATAAEPVPKPATVASSSTTTEKETSGQPSGTKKPPPRPAALPNRATYQPPTNSAENSGTAEPELGVTKRDMVADRAKIANALARGPVPGLTGGVAVLPVGALRGIRPQSSESPSPQPAKPAEPIADSNVYSEIADRDSQPSGEWPLPAITKQRVGLSHSRRARVSSEALRSASAQSSNENIVACDSNDDSTSSVHQPSPRTSQPDAPSTIRKPLHAQNGPASSQPRSEEARGDTSALQVAYTALLKRVDELERTLAAERDERKRLQDDIASIRRALERK